MHRKMTITIDEEVYQGLFKKVGKGKMSQFIEELIRPHVIDSGLEDAYKAMAADQERESEADEWCSALIGDAFDEKR